MKGTACIPSPIAIGLLGIGVAAGSFDAQVNNFLTPATQLEQSDALPALPESQGLSSDALQRLASTVGRYVEEDRIVGAELLVISNRHTVLHEAFGWRDREDEIPMHQNTIFNIRSMTKPLTGAAAQILIDEGKLSLQDRVADYLPGFDNDNSRVITVEQLLTHWSGLPLTILTRVDEYNDLYSMANAIGERGPQFEPGSQFWYSDAGTDALGAVVEVVSGVRLDEFVRQRVLEPLNMNDTFVATDPDDSRWNRIASLYVGQRGSWVKAWTPKTGSFYPFAWGSQTLYSTPKDYARFLTMWMNGGAVDGRRVLSSAAIARTLTPVSDLTAVGSNARVPTEYLGLTTHYGQMSQLWVDSSGPPSAKPVVIGHGGSDGTIAWAWPELDLMVLYFTQSRGQTTWIRLERVIDRLLIHPGMEENESELSEEYQPYLGTYVANFGPFHNTEFTVVLQDGRLAIDIPGGMVYELEDPNEEGKWRFARDPQVAVSFHRNGDGGVAAMKFYQGRDQFELLKGNAPPEPELDLAAIQKYLGWYHDSEANQDVELVIHNGNLAAKVPSIGLPVPVEFFPPDENGRWALRANPTISISFQEDEDGSVVSYTVHHPGGETVRPRIRR